MGLDPPPPIVHKNHLNSLTLHAKNVLLEFFGLKMPPPPPPHPESKGVKKPGINLNLIRCTSILREITYIFHAISGPSLNLFIVLTGKVIE